MTPAFVTNEATSLCCGQPTGQCTCHHGEVQPTDELNEQFTDEQELEDTVLENEPVHNSLNASNPPTPLGQPVWNWDQPQAQQPAPVTEPEAVTVYNSPQDEWEFTAPTKAPSVVQQRRQAKQQKRAATCAANNVVLNRDGDGPAGGILGQPDWSNAF